MPTAEVVEYLQDVAVPAALEEQGGAEEISWDSNDPAKGVATMRKDSERMLIRYHEDVVPRIQPISLEEQHILEHPSLRVPIIGYVDLRSGYDDGARHRVRCGSPTAPSTRRPGSSRSRS